MSLTNIFFFVKCTLFLPRNLHLKLDAYNATEHKMFNFLPEIVDAFTCLKSYDKSDWSSKTQTQSVKKTNCYLWTSSNHPSNVFSINN